MTPAIARTYLPAFKNSTTVHYPSASNKQLQRVIIDLYPQAVQQCSALAPQFAASSPVAECRAVYNFVKNQITYKADGEAAQRVKLPTALVATGTGDCKSYSLFTAGILANLGHKITFRFACYDYSGIPGHVYVLATKGGITTIIDAVWPGPFGSEKKNIKKYDYTMRVESITGINNQYQPVGKIKIKVPAIIKKAAQKVVQAEKKVIQKAKTTVKTTAKKAGAAIKKAAPKVAQTAKKAVGAPSRLAFLALVRLNFHGFANKLAAKPAAQVNASWAKLGGSISDLRNTITVGSRKKPLLGVLNGIGDPATAVATTVVAATPVIIALNAFLKEAKDTSDLAKSIFKTKTDPAGNTTNDTNQGGYDTNTGGGNTTGGDGAPAPNDNTGQNGAPKWLLPVGIGIAALMLMSKK